MGKVGIFFLIVFGVFVFGAPAVAAQDRNSVMGFVFDESRRPVGEVYVELLTDLYATVGRARTSGSGMYVFKNLPAGLYQVKVLNVGTNFEEQVRSVSLVPISVVQGRGIASEQVDFYLRTKKQKNGRPIGEPAVIFAQDTPAEAKSLYEEGVNDLEGENAAGLDKIKRSIEIFPDYYLALDRLGHEYLSRGYYEPAYVLLKKAVTVNPRSFSSTLGLGLAEYRLGRIDLAVDRFKEAVILDKGSINAQLWLGITLQVKGDLAGALTALLEANKLSDGNIPEVHWQLARVYKEQKKFARAADELELFLKLRPDAQNAAEIKGIIATLRQKK